jgi:hypothetical protein
MIIPLHLVPDLHQNAPIYFDLREVSPSYTVGGQAVDPALRPQAGFELGSPIAGPVDSADLHRFQQLMAQEDIALQPTRMLYDRLYAFERLAQGHASANPDLRDLAMHLFNGYQQAGEWIGLMH